MTYMDKTLGGRVAAQDNGGGTGQATREALVLVIEDEYTISSAFRSVCDCLNVAVERMTSHENLGSALRQRCPMAVVAEADAAGQDGCHVMMTVADPAMAPAIIDSTVERRFDARPALAAADSKKARVHSNQ